MEATIKGILFEDEFLFGFKVKDMGYEAYSQDGSKYYVNTDIAVFKMIEWAFDNHRVYLSISLGEDSSESKWYVCNFKHKGKQKSFYGEKNYEAVGNAISYLLKEYQND